MKIVEVEGWVVHAPLKSPFAPSWIPGYSAMSSSAAVYRLRTDDGLEGITAGVAFADEAKGPINLLRAYLLGLDIDDIEEVHSRLSTANRTLGVRAWFLESAFWDLKGKAAGKSVAELLGAKRDRIRAYCSTGSLRSPEDAAQHAVEVLKLGFQGIKIRPRHATVEEDIAMVTAVREAIGDNVALMCDGNQAWRVDTFAKGPIWDLDRAITAATAMRDLGVTWLEEPLDMYDFAGYAELRKQVGLPIAAGELHGDPGLVRLMMDADGVDIVQPDLVLTGGVTGAMQIAKLAASRGLGFAPHTWTNGLGLVQNLHVAMAAENCEWLEFPYDPPGWTPEGRDVILSEPIEVGQDGYVNLPKGPGLGVTLDEEVLSKYGMQI